MNLKPLIAAAALALSSLAAQAATVSLTPVAPAKVGEGVDLLIRVTDPFAGLALDEELLSFGFRLSYDTTQLSFGSFTAAAGWDDDSGWLGAGQFGGSAFPGVANGGQGSLLLGTLHFNALQDGLAQISLITDAGNLNHGLNFLWSGAQPLNASLNLAVSAVPEPASALLAALGLGVLGLTTRRRAASTSAATPASR
ncbi:cohesin domain-containing protein [Mitsuaria sp. GD03876]|uniref:cohesin domain-containing protein n=1 Tax=Mitsuaria sp. GD03876 TaxID=2975399 RepID=UPI0024497698|nr:cohesin domain-containing protein [Mitsuaria sp. GD03876]MDH0867372.1 cohesin domain-containing protein [Mitsuaria sp. GD03876]